MQPTGRCIGIGRMQGRVDLSSTLRGAFDEKKSEKKQEVGTRARELDYVSTIADIARWKWIKSMTSGVQTKPRTSDENEEIERRSTGPGGLMIGTCCSL